jgi:hypothetical protein
MGELDWRAGIGLRAPHIGDLLACDDPPAWVEVHSENWMAPAGPLAERLAEIRRRVGLSLHGVGLSLGSADGIDPAHLKRLAALVAATRALLVSEHLSWSALGGRHSNDLLPLPFTRAVARLLAERIDRVQQALGRRILVENVSSYCTFAASTMPEWDFVREVVERAGCGLLLDLNNVHVNAVNHGFDADQYLDALPWERVGEIHLAGHEQVDGVMIDTHGCAVQAPVWELFERSLPRLPLDARVLVEWDSALPPFATLMDEARRASDLLQEEHAHA